MSTEVTCYSCHETLGTADDGIQPVVFPMAVNVEPHQMMFTIKCPKCGKANHIKLLRNERVNVHKY